MKPTQRNSAALYRYHAGYHDAMRGGEITFIMCIDLADKNYRKEKCFHKRS